MWKLLKLKWVMKSGLIWSHLLCNVLKKLSDAPATWLHTSLRGFVFLRWEHCFFLSFLCFCIRNFCLCNGYIAWWYGKCINILHVDSQPNPRLIFVFAFLRSSPRGRSVWFLHAHRSHCEPGCWCEWTESLWTAPSPQTHCKSWLPVPQTQCPGLSGAHLWQHSFSET